MPADSVEAAKPTVQDAWAKLTNINYEQVINAIMEGAVWIAVKIVAALVIYFVGRQLIRWVVRLMNRTFENHNVDTSLQLFLRSLVKVVLTVALILVIVQTLGVNTSSIIALFASAGLAIGMALSGTLQNFAGGVMLLLLRPYKVGDYIMTEGQSGVVDEIGLFSTRIRTTDNRQIYIPNNTVSSSVIDNYSKSESRRVEWKVSISYGDDVDVARETILAMLNNDKRVLRTPTEPAVYLLELADSAVVLSVRAWVPREEYWSLFFEINERIYKELPEKGVHFPYPQLDVHLKN